MGYDVFDTLAGEVDVRLLVTSGSPLGFPVVKGRSGRPGRSGGRRPQRRAARAPWLDAHDVQHVVCLVHPLRGYSGEAPRDERTHIAGDPHSIRDCLADPDVTRPIGGPSRAGRPGSRRERRRVATACRER